MTDSRLDDLEKRLTSLQEEVRGGLTYLDGRLDRFFHKMRICFADVLQTQDLAEEQQMPDDEVQKEDAGSVDWREELYQKIQSMNELYFEPLYELYQSFSQTVQKEYDTIPSEYLQGVENFKITMEYSLELLQYSRSDIYPDLKATLPWHEKHIIALLKGNNKLPLGPSQPMPQQGNSQDPQSKHHGSCADHQMQSSGTAVQPLKKLPLLAARKETAPDNEYEKSMRSYIIPPNEITVTFEDIGALDEIKELLQELIILPLKRPELFKGLLKPCRGILLFGPPGTGKTMLAKALAHEAGATFINVSMSAIASKWFGDSESNTKALFTLAAKVAPAIIFIDEVDNILGQGTRDSDKVASIRNEFMIHWDGLLTKSEERILVLAATNRPFNLDEAIIRRFERRIMVGLPSLESRELILRTLLLKENAEQLDVKELATMTVGYSSSDLKNLCVAAAYRPLRELIQREKSMRLNKQSTTEEQSIESATACRSLNMEDFREAMNQIAATCTSESFLLKQLEQWNELIGPSLSRLRFGWEAGTHSDSNSLARPAALYTPPNPSTNPSTSSRFLSFLALLSPLLFLGLYVALFRRLEFKMTNARVDDLEKRLTGLEKELRGGLEDLNSRMLSRFTDVDRRVEVVLDKLEGLTGRKRGIVPRSDDALLKRIRDVIWSYFFSSTWTISATAKTKDARSVDWREEVYREIQTMNENYFEELNEIHQRLNLSWQQLQSRLSAKAYQSLGNMKNKIDHILKTLQCSKSDIQTDLKDLLPVYKRIIILYVDFCKKCIDPLLPYLLQQGQPQGPQLRQLDGCTDNQMNMQSSETSVQPPKNLPCLAACKEAASDDENEERVRSDNVPLKEATSNNECEKTMRSDIAPPKEATPNNKYEKRMTSDIVAPKEATSNNECEKTMRSDIAPPKEATPNNKYEKRMTSDIVAPKEATSNNECEKTMRSDIAPPKEATSNNECEKRMRSDIAPPKEATPNNKYEKRIRSDIVVPKKAKPDNEHEKRMRSYIVPPKKIRVTFEDIGALDETKKLLHELIILPLQRPELFKGLLEPSRGILLFGPPGTGKTMLAKALAHEAGATFINVSMSSIASKWFGHSESNTRALFTLAAKVAPTIIFIDEVDCMLGQRSGERDTIASVKNEFMIHWDGLLTNSEDRILVLAATNRPFNLDEPIIRRFEHRIMVGLPSQESRESILRTLLSKEKTEQLDFKELATMTVGYSGSDLKNLCVAAAYRPLRELIQREQSMSLKKQSNKQGSVEPTTACRSINMEDLRKALNQVAKSCATESSLVEQLEEWNELFGDGGSRKKQQLSYFI
ncbi:AAA-type ATPase family protein [Musa troglodytarum]|uniref:AAA-type ATPase family protein n=2 Tax=Musa troglodytarum TaxID=320322 RepID=A0A9E7JGI0_9LILI|nr:AAA-type ATPase family protein [Musa troglodytarum]